MVASARDPRSPPLPDLLLQIPRRSDEPDVAERLREVPQPAAACGTDLLGQEAAPRRTDDPVIPDACPRGRFLLLVVFGTIGNTVASAEEER